MATRHMALINKALKLRGGGRSLSVAAQSAWYGQINAYNKAKAPRGNPKRKYKNISSVPERFLDERH